MADEEILSIIKQGTTEWSNWRLEPDQKIPDLKGADLTGANLTGRYLSGLNLSEADLSEALLTNCKFSDTNLKGTKFNAAYLGNANLSGAYAELADFSNANLSYANLNNIKLHNANLEQANLFHTDLTSANLSNSNLHGARLDATNFNNADLTNTDFCDARINSVCFGSNDISMAKGLETVIHFGPSIISIETIYRSKGNIPDIFLRGAGVPENFLTYMASLTGKAFEFYSCFISYSSKDQSFAERLYADLQNKGVRCWFAPEDLEIGEMIRPRIDESIRMHDKLLLILSKNSVHSQWVEQEVETALAKEREQERIVLFPIRLDDTIMQTLFGWPAFIKNTRHIGDFCGWKNHDQYQYSLNRLLRDLKS